jgi:putative transposase
MYYQGKSINKEDIVIMNEIRSIYEKQPFYGYRKIHAALRSQGYTHNRKKTQRLMQLTGLQAIYAKKKTSISNVQHKKYPYLLRKLDITRANDVWQVDITYIKLRTGYAYLVCFIDVFSRRIMGWAFSPFLNTDLCISALERSLKMGKKPKIINSDQGSQFTSEEWIKKLTELGIQISMDGIGRWADNIYIERLWRTIKYEAIYLHSFDSVQQAQNCLEHYIKFYNSERFHQSLGYKTPDFVYNFSIDDVPNTRQNQEIIIFTNGGMSILKI